MLMTFLINRLRVGTFEGAAIKKNESLVEEVGILQKTVSKKHASLAGVKEQLRKLKVFLSMSDELAAKFAESDEELEADRTEVASLNGEVVRAETEKKGTEKKVAKVHEEAEQRMVSLNVALNGRTRAENVRRSLVTPFVNVVDTVGQKLDQDAVYRL